MERLTLPPIRWPKGGPPNMSDPDKTIVGEGGRRVVAKLRICLEQGQ